MLDAKGRIGISFFDYCQFDFHLIPIENQEQQYPIALENKKSFKEKRIDRCIKYVMSEIGCDRDTAEDLYYSANENYGISARDYCFYRLYELPEEEQAVRIKALTKSLEDRALIREARYEAALEKIMKATGWTREKALREVWLSRKYSGASTIDYYDFRLWEISFIEQRDYFTAKLSRRMALKYDELTTTKLLVNKENFLKKYSDKLGREWAINNQISKEDFIDKFGSEEKIVYKPTENGYSGARVKIFKLNDGADKVFDDISKLPIGIIEGFIVQHPSFSEIYPSAVNTMRIATVCYADDNGGEQLDILYAVLRMGNGGSKIDNFTRGGLVAVIDIEKGEVVTNAVNRDNISYENHPDTGTRIKGFKPPFFKEALELLREAGKDIYGYIGWDVAITENGPVLIEANVGPGNHLIQMPFIEERKGMAHIFKDYL